MRNLHVALVDILRPLAFGLIGCTVIIALVCWRLGDLTGGIHQVEVPNVEVVQARSLSAHDIVAEPLFLPYKVGLYVLEKTGLTTIGAIRGVSAAFATAGAVAFYLLLHKWHTRRIAFLGTTLLVTSSWWLHSARLAVPESSYLLLPAAIYLGAKLVAGKQRLLAMAASFFLFGLLLYVPGLVLFIVPAVIWQRRRILRWLSEQHPVWLTGLLSGTLVLLLPLVLSLVSGRTDLTAWLGFTATNLSAGELVKNTVSVPLQLFVRTDGQPVMHLGQLPLLDIATIIFAALGSYWYFFHRRLDRTKLIIGGVIIGTWLTAIGSLFTISILIPFVYLLAVAGITLLLQQWFTVFPRNPLARSVGVCLIIGVVGLISFYHLRRYFVAWPNTPETRRVFDHHH